MLSKLAQSIKTLGRREPVVDPASFNDPLALRTSWTPCVRGGTNFRTHKLDVSDPNCVRFLPALGTKLFGGLFLLVGLGVTVGVTVSRLASGNALEINLDTLVPLVLGLVFTVVGGVMLAQFGKPIVFDKVKGYYWKGRQAPDQVFDPSTLKHCAPISRIHALQLIAERCHGNKQSYYSYELNLVLDDGERKNVIDHGNRKALREDAQTLSAFLGKPVWDAT